MAHSEEYLNDQRFDWYNQDFLELMAKRWDLASMSVVADVGCGLCHWSRMLLPFLSKPAQIYGVDYEMSWIEESQKLQPIFNQNGAELKLIKGSAYSLDFPDNFFDLVTCQTLLIHLENPLAALTEFRRVLKPGGKFICAEPNNIINPLIFDQATLDQELEEILNNLGYEIKYARGKKALGEGDTAFPEGIPQFLNEAQFKNVQVYLSDKVDSYPVGDSVDFLTAFHELGQIKEKSQRYYLAGNGTLEDFENYWNHQFKVAQKKAEFYKDKVGSIILHGFLMYMISGEK